MIYLVTHGKDAREKEITNPKLAREGLNMATCSMMIGSISLIVSTGTKLVMKGTGSRITETFLAMTPALRNIPVKSCPFLGLEDWFDDKKQVFVTASGEEIPKNDYLGVADCPGVSLWKLIASFPNATVAFVNRQAMIALGATKTKS